MNSNLFVEQLCALSFENAFNPYSDRCPVHDMADAPIRRSRVLLALLNAATCVEVDSIWIGRDLGYRGGRRTGLALTDDIHLWTHLSRWKVDLERPTKGSVVAERTAAVIWAALSHIQSPVFLWNVFPLHPHKADDPFSNRAHNSVERASGEQILRQLITLLNPRRLVAVGNDAAVVARRIADKTEVLQVRHPSYGGQTQFLEQIGEIYGLSGENKQRRLL